MFPKKKRSYPLNVHKNNYREHTKESSVETPPDVAARINEIVSCDASPQWLARMTKIVDIGCGHGNLSIGFHANGWRKGVTYLGIDKVNRKYPCGKFVQTDFLKLQKSPTIPGETLILCNPPFNDKALGRKLLPEVFLRKIFELWGYNIAVVLHVPMGFLFNQRRSSPRVAWLKKQQSHGLNITSRLVLPIDAYENVLFHNEVLFFNIPGLEPIYYL